MGSKILNAIDSECLDCLGFAVKTLESKVLSDVGIKGGMFIDKGFGPQVLQLVDLGYMHSTMIEQNTQTLRAGIYYQLTDKGRMIYQTMQKSRQN